MANLAIVTTVRQVNGSNVTAVYMGTLKDDGWVYFNDEIWWRCRSDKSSMQRFYIPKQVWVPANGSMVTSINMLNVTQVQNIINGSGAAATNANIETAVQWAINKAENEYITYSQITRNLKNPNGSSYDCSSFVITAMYVGGFDAAATYTGDMKSAFQALGFTWIPGSYFAAEDCLRGDILLNETYHTQMYIGNNQDVNCGDTPARVTVHSPDNWGSNWDGILRYTG